MFLRIDVDVCRVGRAEQEAEVRERSLYIKVLCFGPCRPL